MVENAAHVTEVVETGLAVVHQGEVILAAADSRAQTRDAGDSPGAVVEYRFPVEIEVRGSTTVPDPHQLMQLTLDHLARQIEAIG
jgi:hypothetical protein